MFFSKSTNGFYVSEIHGNNIPSDAVEISNELYNELMLGQSNGKQITADNSNNPILIDQTYTALSSPTKVELLAQLQELTAKIEALGEV